MSTPARTPPHCPDGHGPMHREAGFWGLVGADRRPPRTLLTGPEFSPNGKVMIVKVWICPVCALVRTYADDTED